jgi:hypothetical protein
MNPMRRRFQFSIRFLLVATVAVAAGAAAIRAKPSVKSGMAIECLTLAFSTAAAVGAILTNRKSRTFWIGAALVLVPASFLGAHNFMLYGACILLGTDPGTIGFVGEHHKWILWSAALLNGLFAVLLHWLFAPNEVVGK